MENRHCTARKGAHVKNTLKKCTLSFGKRYLFIYQELIMCLLKIFGDVL